MLATGKSCHRNVAGGWHSDMLVEMFPRFLALMLFAVVSASAATPAKPWQKIDGFWLIPNHLNDGDSFHVQAGIETYLFRLYFVDTPETEAEYADRLKDQADYFGIPPSESVKLGFD